ncbi:MAG: hypothetical protein HRU14_05270 [Planctomycetes bacterium]|nr:hypothetical protein [Planctomycetota bacterium]
MPRLLVSLAVLAALVFTQEPPSKRDALRARLKKAVDQSLARFVRDLRVELHRAVDSAVDSGDPDAVADLLEELQSRGRPVQPKPKFVIEPAQLVMVDRVLRRLDRLRAVSGTGHPRFKQVESSVRELLGSAIDVPRAPWHKLGVSVAPVSDAFRARHGLAPGSGLSVVAVEAGSLGAAMRLHEGEAIIACGGKPVGLGQSGSVELARLLTVSGRPLTHLEVVGKDGQRSARALRLPGGMDLAEDDPKALLEAMLRKALDEVIPKGPVVVPPKKKGGDKELR